MQARSSRSRNACERNGGDRPRSTNVADRVMCDIADEYTGNGESDKATAILQPLAEKDLPVRSTTLLVHTFEINGQATLGLKWSTLSSLQGEEISAFLAMRCCQEIQPPFWPQARFWLDVARKRGEDDSPGRTKDISSSLRIAYTPKELQGMRCRSKHKQPQTLQGLQDVFLLQR